MFHRLGAHPVLTCLAGAVLEVAVLLPFTQSDRGDTYGVVGAVGLGVPVVTVLAVGRIAGLVVSVVGGAFFELALSPHEVLVSATLFAVWTVLTWFIGQTVCQLYTARDRERSEIAVALHDGPLQELIAVLLMLEIGRWDLAEEKLRESVESTRKLIFQLERQDSERWQK